MKVLLVAAEDDSRRGGSLRVAESLAVGLQRAGVDAHLVFVYGEPTANAPGTNVPVHHLRIERSRRARHWIRLRRFIARQQPDVVHFVDNVLWAPIAIMGLRSRTLLHVHGRPREIGFSSKPMPRAERLAWRLWRATRVEFVCITQGVHESIVRLGLAREERTHTLYNAIDVSRFEAGVAREASRLALGLPPDALVLGTVCRVVRGRGLEDMVDVLARLPARWHGLIVGDGPARQEIRSLASARGVTERLHMSGHLDDVRPAYAAMDAYGFFARYDSFGLATAEAMASGVPVFGLKGLGEYADHPRPLITERTALFIPRADPLDQYATESTENLDRLAAVLAAHGRDPTEGLTRAKRAKEHVCLHFDIPTQAREAIALYRRVMEGA